MGWDLEIESWQVALRAAGRRRATVELRGYQLRRVATELRCAPAEVTGWQLVQWVGSQGWDAETLRSWRSALRGFFGWAHGVGLVDVDPALALPAVKPSEPNPRPTPEDEYRVGLARADERVRLMLRLAAELGMRRGEVARAHSRDLWRDLFGWSIAVHGKGGKTRPVPVPAGLAALIRSRGEGYLFPGRDHGHLSPAHVGRLVSRALPGAWAMHSLRHRFGTAAWSVDHDLLTVQELLGHASPVTTRRYVRVPNERLRATVRAVGEL